MIKYEPDPQVVDFIDRSDELVKSLPEWKRGILEASSVPSRENERKPMNQDSIEEENKETQKSRSIYLLNKWLEDESDYDETTWSELKEAIEKDRLSSRYRFKKDD